jgi:hypothetical protein
MRDRLWDKGEMNMHGEGNEISDSDKKRKLETTEFQQTCDDF